MLYELWFKATHPDESIFENLRKGPVDSVTDVFDGDTIAQNNGVSEIGTIARLLGENADQIQVLPQRIKQVVKVQLHFATEKAA